MSTGSCHGIATSQVWTPQSISPRQVGRLRPRLPSSGKPLWRCQSDALSIGARCCFEEWCRDCVWPPCWVVVFWKANIMTLDVHWGTWVLTCFDPWPSTKSVVCPENREKISQTPFNQVKSRILGEAFDRSSQAPCHSSLLWQGFSHCLGLAIVHTWGAGFFSRQALVSWPPTRIILRKVLEMYLSRAPTNHVDQRPNYPWFHLRLLKKRSASKTTLGVWGLLGSTPCPKNRRKKLMY